MGKKILFIAVSEEVAQSDLIQFRDVVDKIKSEFPDWFFVVTPDFMKPVDWEVVKETIEASSTKE